MTHVRGFGDIPAGTHLVVIGPDRHGQYGVALAKDPGKASNVVFSGIDHANATRLAQSLGVLKNPRKRAAKTRKKNPQLLVINPGDAAMVAAARAYKRFHGMAPPADLIKKGTGKGILISVGWPARIDYQTRRGERKGPRWFHHFKKQGCLLCVTPDGKQLVIMSRSGRRLFDFDRGITG